MMKVKEIEEGKKACVLIDCGQAHVYYPRAGEENDPEATCNSMRLEWQGASGDDDEDEPQSDQDAVYEAANLLDIPEDEIELAYG